MDQGDWTLVFVITNIVSFLVANWRSYRSYTRTVDQLEKRIRSLERHP